MFRYPFLIPLIVACVVQIIKLLIDSRKSKTFSRDQMWTAGGFPSVHSAITSSLLTVIYLQEGLVHSIDFALACSFAFLFRYDAMNVRYETGKHAKYLNDLKHELHNVLAQHDKDFSQLKERIGHTPFEVAGGIV